MTKLHLPICCKHFLKGRKLRFKLENLGTNQIKKFLLSKYQFSNIRLKSRLMVIGIFCVLFASTGPQIGMKMTELKRKGIDIMVLLDTSTSMNAVDVKPSRIEKAKYELNRLIDQLKGDRIGLIAFAGSAHLHCPLTEDYAAAKLFLNMMDTNIILDQGTDLSAAIDLALSSINRDESKYKIIILVSDGEEHQGEVILLAEQAKELGVIIHSVGVGSNMGGPIPIYDKDGEIIEFKKDNNGQVVTSVLNENILRNISAITYGEYIRVANQINAIVPIIESITQMDKKEFKSHIFSDYEDRYQYFLLIGLILLFLEFIIPTKSNKKIIWTGRFSSSE